MNKHEMHRLARIDATRANQNLANFKKDKDQDLFLIKEKARQRWWKKKMDGMY